MKRKPVKHLANCRHCFKMGEDGFRTRVNAICHQCPVYNKCIASQTDRALKGAMRRVNKTFGKMIK